MKPLKNVILPLAMGVLCLCGGGAMVAASPAITISSQPGSATAQGELLRIEGHHHGGAGMHSGNRGGGGGGGGHMIHRSSPPSGFSGPKPQMDGRIYGGSRPHLGSSRPFKPYSAPNYTIGGNHKPYMTSHRRHRHYRHGRYYYYSYPYLDYDTEPTYDYTYADGSYSYCYRNCRSEHGPRYCRRHWRKYCR